MLLLLVIASSSLSSSIMKRISLSLLALIAVAPRGVSSWNDVGFPGWRPPRRAGTKDEIPPQPPTRRQVLTAAGLASSSLLLTSKAPAASAADSLAARLSKRDASVLQNRLFNVPPSAQVFPEFLRGDWRVQSKFSGYLFPSKAISKERLTQNFGIAGFQKCSIANTADVGKENVSYNYRIDPQTGLEDRAYNFQQQIDAYLGYPAVRKVLYDGRSNPNRIGIDFIDYKTINAERIELFFNARESETYTLSLDDTTTIPVFVCAEYLRQVTFGTGSTVGVPRQVVTNYANFWTWRPDDENGSGLKGNLLTCAYLDPQDAMYFQEPNKPVAVYSHVLKATRQ